jgi:hypothetical protein
MRQPTLPANEADRLAALCAHDVLDTAPEPAFDDLARLASHVCGTPIALISLVGRPPPMVQVGSRAVGA